MAESESRKAVTRGRWVAGLLLALVAHSWLWNQPWLPYAESRVWRVVDADQYAIRRRQEAFRGVPFDLIAARLSAILPMETTVRLGDRLASSAFWFQRASEVFYPRRISQRSGEVVETDDAADPSAVLLGTDARGWRYVLRGVQRESDLAGNVREGFPLRPLWFLLTIIACFGIGGVCNTAWTRIWERKGQAQEGVSILACAAAVGIAASVLTWLQLPALGVTFQGLGLLAWIWMVLFHRANLRLGAEQLRLAIRRPALWLALAVAGLLFMRLQAVPISWWDGRSIWLFQAKQAYFTGTFASGDLLHPEFAFAHPEYPKLLPAWLALFAPLGSTWNERMASLGIPVFAGGCIWALAVVAIKRLGVLRGVLLVCVLFWSVQGWVLGGYAEGYLLFALVTGVLGLADSRTRALGWLALLVASLVKYEGLFLAAVVAVIAYLRDPEMQARPGRWRPMLVFIPAGLHLLWGYGMGFKGDFSGIRWLEVWETLGDRMAVIAQAAVEVVGRTPILLEGALGALAGFLLLTAGPKASRRQGGLESCCLIVAAVWTAWIFMLFLVTPRDLTWHLHNALDRLLVHPAALALVTVLSLTRDSTGAEEGMRGTSD